MNNCTLASREASAPPKAYAPRWSSKKRKSSYSSRQSVIPSIYLLLLLQCASAFQSQAQLSGLAALNLGKKSKSRDSTSPQKSRTVLQGNQKIMVLPPSISLTDRLQDELAALNIWSSRKKPKIAKTVLQVDEKEPMFGSAPIPLSYRLQDTDPVDATAGVLFGFGILFTLGVSTTKPDEVATLVAEDGVWNGFAFPALNNLFDATVPTTAADVIAVTLGESIGGVIGAVATGVGSLVMTRQWPSLERPGLTRSLVTEAIADSDFFIANSASRPLLQAVGLPPVLASVGSIFVATASSQLVKLGARRKDRLLEEEQLLQKLLEEDQEKERKREPLKFLLKGFNKKVYVRPKDLVPVAAVQIDFIDIFSDVARWLEYGILKADYQDTLLYNGVVVDTAVSGAFFGLLAAVSSQLYADVLYGYFRKGPGYKQSEVRSRKIIDWATVYVSTSISAAALFGIYELSKRPVSRYVQGMLAGGVEGCVGSNSFDFCLQTYIDANAPGASPEAQLRALLTNLVMVGERLQVIAVDTSADDMHALVAAWAVTGNSFFFHQLPQMLSEIGNW
jgi:hypothetical protein